MTRELINANITHVSYVDKGANKKQFFLTKADKQPDFKKDVKLFIDKAEDEKQLVYGVVYEPDIEDSHGDYMTSLEIEKAAHGFMKDARNIDKQHDFNAGVGEVVESYITPADFEISDTLIKKGSWVLVTKASDEIWEEIKKGEITGYSMAGTAETIEKQEYDKPTDEMRGFFNALKSFFTKAEVRDNYDNKQKQRNLWAAWDSMCDIFYDCIWDNHTVDVADFTKLKDNVNDFAEIIDEIHQTGDIQKALQDRPEEIKKRGAEDMKKEDLAKLFDEKLEPVVKRLEAIEKGENEEAGLEEEGEVGPLEQLSKMLAEKMNPVLERLETLEKARGVSKQLDSDEEKIKKSEGSIWDGLI